MQRNRHLSLVPPIGETQRREERAFFAVDRPPESVATWLAEYYKNHSIRPIGTGPEFLSECRELARELDRVDSRLEPGITSIVGVYYDARPLCEASVQDGTLRLLEVLVTPSSLLGIVVKETQLSAVDSSHVMTEPFTVQLSYWQGVNSETEFASWVAAHSSGAILVNMPLNAPLTYMLSPGSVMRIYRQGNRGDRVCATARLILDLESHPDRWADLKPVPITNGA